MEPVGEAILNVLTIVALIGAIAVIIILLVDLILSITNKKGSILFRDRSGKDKESKDANAEVSGRPQVLEEDTAHTEPTKTWDEEAAAREQQALLSGKTGMPDEYQPAEEKKSFAEERQESIERRKKEFDDFDDFDSLFEEPTEVTPEPVKEEPTEDDFNFDDMINEINAESVTKYEAEANEPEVIEPVEEIEPEMTEVEIAPEAETTTETTEETVTTKEESAESTETTAVVEEPAEEDEEVAVAPIEPVVEPKPVVGVYEYFPLEQLEARLKKLQARLKVNERDLRGNRKEYKPLARVKRNLERDQEKLRRKEAIVARKKVLLYGVNNYVDIDEEKAKKLSEDLDLLDGLRLSVQHCEEVMEQNKDRFPILEKTNQILVEQNQQIKDDIAEVEDAIAKLKANNTDETAE